MAITSKFVKLQQPIGPVQTTSINFNNSYYFQGMDYAYPGGTPGTKPYPTGAFTLIGFFRANPSAFGASQTYQTMLIANCAGHYGTCALEVILAGGSHPFDDQIYIGGYDQVNAPNGEEYTTGWTGSNAQKWTAYAFSWDGVGGASGNPITFRYRRHNDPSWTSGSFAPSTGGYQYANGNLYNIIVGWPIEQPTNIDACCVMSYTGVLSDSQLNEILNANGNIPSSLTSQAVRHFPLASAATANQELVAGANGVFGGTATDVSASPFPWVY